ncbi:MAG: hypothetical protein LBG09_02015 [Puniceicoccales bacterium]|jgi:hypothetical protein|nr:hypothetical protein [Puniceicoccales bacterium]
MSSIDPIEAGSSGDKRLDVIRSMMGLDDGPESVSSEYSASHSSPITPAADAFPIEANRADIPPTDDIEISSANPIAMKTVAATEEVGNMEAIEDSDNDGIPDHVDVNPNSESVSPATQAFLDAVFHTDTDSDGILDFLDKTGSESQMEQWYDEEFKMQTEMVRAFASLMSIFNNLDLTKFSGQSLEPGGDSLTVMAMAGAAQVAITHSAALQNPPANIQPNKEDVKKLIEQYKNLDNKGKRLNLTHLLRAVEELPKTDPMRELLLKECKTALAKRGKNVAS